MDTRLTKTYTIIFLLVLNIALALTNFIIKEKYIISNGQEEAIIQYAKEKEIFINTNLPKKYEPMLEMSMLRAIHDEKFLKGVFFGESSVDTMKQDKETVFYRDNSILIINDRYVLYKDKTYDKSIIYTEKEAKKIAQKYANALSEKYGKMYIDNIIKNNNYFNINYIQKMEGYKMFNNILSITIYNGGGLEIYFNNYKKAGNINFKRSIYSVDEAIYTFTREIKNLIVDEDIYITSVDLGYYLREIEDSIYFSLIPYYRIYIKGNNVPFYINAYTNELEYGIDSITLSL